jgi:hypothetical protein
VALSLFCSALPGISRLDLIRICGIIKGKERCGSWEDYRYM